MDWTENPAMAAMQHEIATLQQDRQRIPNHNNHIQEQMESNFQAAFIECQELEANNIEFRNRLNDNPTSTTGSCTEDNEMKRIMNTNLFKGQEFTRFQRKDNYEIWIDSVNNDFYSMLPDARKFVEYAVKPPTPNGRITPSDVKTDSMLEL